MTHETREARAVRKQVARIARDVGRRDAGSKRILVTGSRTWDDTQAIEQALLPYLPSPQNPVRHTLVHGACPDGADHIAHLVGKFGGMEVEAHPADWKTHGKAAGFIRNQQMVNRGAAVCLAFIRDGSRGATDCANRAEKAGIPVKRFEVTS